jgi:hypothetical protein
LETIASAVMAPIFVQNAPRFTFSTFKIRLAFHVKTTLGRTVWIANRVHNAFNASLACLLETANVTSVCLAAQSAQARYANSVTLATLWSMGRVNYVIKH